MLKNLTKGKMVEYIILLIALVALGLSIAAVSTGCVSHFAGYTCQDGDGGVCPIGVRGKSCSDVRDCTSPKHPDAPMNCSCDSSGRKPIPTGGPCDSDDDCKSIHDSCVEDKKGVKRCTRCVDTGETCTPSVDHCCDEDDSCVKGEMGYRCNTKTTKPVKCGTKLDPPIDGKCCEGLTPQQNPYHPSSLACLPKSGIKIKCMQPSPECDMNGKECHCEGKKGICQAGNSGMLGMCVPYHNSKTKTQHDSNLNKKSVPSSPLCTDGQTYCKPLKKCLDEGDNSCVAPDPPKKHDNLPLIIGSSVGGFLLLLVLIFLLMRK